MKIIVIILSTAIILSGCSTYYKGSHALGVSAEDINQCQDKDCFLGLGSDMLDTKHISDDATEVIYKVKRRNGSYPHAIAHGVADVATLGIWDTFSTPISEYAGHGASIDGYMSDRDSIVYKVIYDGNGGVTKLIIQGN